MDDDVSMVLHAAWCASTTRINDVMPDGLTMGLHEAFFGDPMKAVIWLRHGGNPNLTAPADGHLHGYSIGHVAMDTAHPAMLMTAWLEAGGDPNATDAAGRTPMHLMHRSLESVYRAHDAEDFTRERKQDALFNAFRIWANAGGDLHHRDRDGGMMVMARISPDEQDLPWIAAWIDAGGCFREACGTHDAYRRWMSRHDTLLHARHGNGGLHIMHDVNALMKSMGTRHRILSDESMIALRHPSSRQLAKRYLPYLEPTHMATWIQAIDEAMVVMNITP
jgi:hypothetical protein